MIGVDSGWSAYRAGSVEDLKHALLTVHLHLLPVGVLNGGVILLNKNALQYRKMCFKTFNQCGGSMTFWCGSGSGSAATPLANRSGSFYFHH